MRANDKMSTKGVRALGRNVAAALLLLASASVTSEPAVAGCSGRNCYNPEIGTDYGSPKSGTDTSKGLTYHVLKAQKQKFGRCRNC